MDDEPAIIHQIPQYLFRFRLAILLLFISLLSMLAAWRIYSKFKEEESSIVIDSLSTEESSVKGKMLKVDIAGAVTAPGVYEMLPSQRVEDVVNKAGGFEEHADKQWIQKNLNQAMKLSDGAKIYIPYQGELNDSKQNFDHIININSASLEVLSSLEGVGDKTAGKIIDSRPFYDLSDLVKKKIISQNLFNKLKDQISL